jgi:hypothetical protein
MEQTSLGIRLFNRFHEKARRKPGFRIGEKCFVVQLLRSASWYEFGIKDDRIGQLAGDLWTELQADRRQVCFGSPHRNTVGRCDGVVDFGCFSRESISRSFVEFKLPPSSSHFWINNVVFWIKNVVASCARSLHVGFRINKGQTSRVRADGARPRVKPPENK